MKTTSLAFLVSLISILVVGCTNVPVKTFVVNQGGECEKVYINTKVMGTRCATTRVVVDVTSELPPGYFVSVRLPTQSFTYHIRACRTVMFMIPESCYTNGEDHMIVSVFREGTAAPLDSRDIWIPSGGPFSASFIARNGQVVADGGHYPQNRWW